MTLSIIIPAFDEERKIRGDILSANQFCIENNLEAEIIIVDDGSRDNTFKIAVESKELIETKLTVVKNKRNSGKGFSVKTGILLSEGEYVMYADAGTTVPFEYIKKGLSLLQDDKYDMAFGSRKMEGSIVVVPQKKDRRTLSRLFLLFIKSFLAVPETLTDTQCGFKVYKGKVARELFHRLETKGFLFEIEIILMALKENYRIAEFPVQWKCDRDSRINICNTLGGVLYEAIRLKLKKY